MENLEVSWNSEKLGAARSELTTISFLWAIWNNQERKYIEILQVILLENHAHSQADACGGVMRATALSVSFPDKHSQVSDTNKNHV